MGLLEGAAIALVFFLIGRFVPSRSRASKLPKPPEPVCGCEHHHSFHDAESGSCHGTVREATHFQYSKPAAWRQVPCTCRRYSGPEPMPSYFAPEIAGE